MRYVTMKSFYFSGKEEAFHVQKMFSRRNGIKSVQGHFSSLWELRHDNGVIFNN